MTIKVKSLRWFEVARYRHGGKYTADGYTIRYIEGFFILDFASESKATWRLTTIEAAKAAAQADYEARILSAIEEVDPAAIRAEAWRKLAGEIGDLGDDLTRIASAVEHGLPLRAYGISDRILAIVDKEQDHGR